MNPEQDNFQNVRRLLSLKRYEQPPPGYFEGFSAQVIARVRSGQHLREPSFIEWLVGGAPWMERLRGLFETKPMLAGGFGLAACALLVAGIVHSESAEPVTVSLMPAGPVAVTRVFEGLGHPSGLAPTGAIPAGFAEPGTVSDGQLRDSLFKKPRNGAQLISFPVGN
jgi:hypothetical protein